MDRLLEKAQGPNPGLFRFLGSVQSPPHHDPMPFANLSTRARKVIAKLPLFEVLLVTTKLLHNPLMFGLSHFFYRSTTVDGKWFQDQIVLKAA